MVLKSPLLSTIWNFARKVSYILSFFVEQCSLNLYAVKDGGKILQMKNDSVWSRIWSATLVLGLPWQMGLDCSLIVCMACCKVWHFSWHSKSSVSIPVLLFLENRAKSHENRILVAWRQMPDIRIMTGDDFNKWPQIFSFTKNDEKKTAISSQRPRLI